MRTCRRAAVFVALSFMIVSSLASLPSAQIGGVPVNCVIVHQVIDMGTCLTYAIPLAAAGILLSLLIVAITYMLSEVIHIDSLKGWYKNELKETAKSMIIIAIVVSSLAIMGGISSILVSPYAGAAPISAVQTGTNPSTIQSNFGNLYNAAVNYLDGQQAKGAEAFSGIVGLSLGIGLIKTAVLYLWIPFPIIPDPLPPFAVLWFHFGSQESIYQSTIIDSSSATGTANLAFIRDVYEFLILPMYIAFTVQADLLPILVQVGLLVLLPIGIILRAIPFVRGIGGTLIAIGIAVALIYPTVLVTLNVPASSLLIGTNANVDNCQIPIPLLGTAICWVASEIPSAIGVYAGVDSLSSIYPAFNFIQYYTYPIIVQFVLLLLDAVIVITTAQYLAKLLGGSIRLGIGGRLKLA